MTDFINLFNRSFSTNKTNRQMFKPILKESKKNSTLGYFIPNENHEKRKKSQNNSSSQSIGRKKHVKFQDISNVSREGKGI